MSTVSDSRLRRAADLLVAALNEARAGVGPGTKQRVRDALELVVEAAVRRAGQPAEPAARPEPRPAAPTGAEDAE